MEQKSDWSVFFNSDPFRGFVYKFLSNTIFIASEK